MFIVVWKYTVSREKRDAFQNAYGKNGIWSKLFSTSDKYQGALLHQSMEEANTYFIIDQWVSQADYDHFMLNHNDTYQKISKLLEHLYDKEEKTGAFELVK